MTRSRASSPTQPKRVPAVIAIDPGFDRVGVAIMKKELGKEKLLFSECIQTDPKSKKEERLLKIGARVNELIKKWKPQDMAIETLFFNQNTSSAMGVSEARGIIVYEAMRAELRLFEYSPQAIKIAVTGYGKANKSQIMAMVPRLVDMKEVQKPRLDDEIDAIAVGITHLASTTNSGYPHK